MQVCEMEEGGETSKPYLLILNVPVHSRLTHGSFPVILIICLFMSNSMDQVAVDVKQDLSLQKKSSLYWSIYVNILTHVYKLWVVTDCTESHWPSSEMVRTRVVTNGACFCHVTAGEFALKLNVCPLAWQRVLCKMRRNLKFHPFP